MSQLISVTVSSCAAILTLAMLAEFLGAIVESVM